LTYDPGVAKVLNKKAGIFFIVFAAGLIAAIPLRTMLILFNIDPKTGFYYGKSPLITVVNILFLAVTVVLLVPLFMRGFRKLSAEPRRSAAIGVISAAAAVFMLVDAAYDLVMFKTGGASMIFNALFEFAAVAFFILFSTASFKGGKIAFPVAALLPVLWATVHLMAAFMHYTTVVNISEYLYDMLKMVFVMLFFYYHARFAGRVTNGNEIKGMLGVGLPAVFFCLVSTLPRYIALAMGRNVTVNLTEDLLFVVLSVYISAVLISVFFSKPLPVPEPEPGAAESEIPEGPQAG
jgi:hypothetical protein